MNAKELIDGLTSGKLKVANVATLDGAGKSADVLATFTYAAERQEPGKRTRGQIVAEQVVTPADHHMIGFAASPELSASGVSTAGSAYVAAETIRSVFAKVIDAERASAAREAAEKMRDMIVAKVSQDWCGHPMRAGLVAAIRALPLPAATTTEGRD